MGINRDSNLLFWSRLAFEGISELHDFGPIRYLDAANINGYCPYLFVIDGLKELGGSGRPKGKLRVVSAIYAVDIIGLVLFAGVLKWI